MPQSLPSPSVRSMRMYLPAAASRHSSKSSSTSRCCSTSTVAYHCFPQITCSTKQLWVK
jgi:hypothetical protein